MQDLQAFAGWLKRRRKALDLTREALARRSHCSVSTLRRLEAADLRASRQLAEALAAGLDLPAAQRAEFVRFARGESGQPPPEDARALSQPPAVGLLNLPAPLTSFVGRRHEVAAVIELLHEPGVRLLTLTGPPGTGKTRLSIAVARELAASPLFPDGACFVPLASVSEPGLIVAATAQALGVREAHGHDLADVIADFVRPKRLLLVFDNFEQLVAAAGYLTGLLSAAPGAKALVTSREALHAYGEHEFPVPPLAVPDAFHLPTTLARSFYAQYGALHLFQERARAARPGFRLTADNVAEVARICAWLDGLPLAIEMAAAQVKWLSTGRLYEQLSHRLGALTGGPRDLSPRQQTLRGAIDWSFDLLDADEQRWFARLGVFAGSFTTPDAEGLARHLAETGPVSGVLQSLARKSLLRSEAGAHSLLQTIREYALEKLARSGEAEAVRDAHLRYCLATAEQADRQLHGPDQLTWLDWFEHEHDNLGAALDWAIRGRRVEAALRLGAALGWFWRVRGYLSEGRRWLEAILALPAGGELAVPRARALTAAGLLAFYHQADYASAQALYEESLALSRAAGDRAATARTLSDMGHLAWWRAGDGAQSRALLQEGLETYRALGDEWGQALALSRLGQLAGLQGDVGEARAHIEQSLQLYQALGDRWGAAYALWSLGDVARKAGDYVLARDCYTQCLSAARLLADRTIIAFSLADLADIALAGGEFAPAEGAAREALAIFQAIGEPWQPPRLKRILAYAALNRGEGATARSLNLESLRLNRALSDRRGEAASLVALAHIHLAEGRRAPAARLLQAVEGALVEKETQLLPCDQRYFAEGKALLAADIGDQSPLSLEAAALRELEAGET